MMKSINTPIRYIQNTDKEVVERFLITSLPICVKVRSLLIPKLMFTMAKLIKNNESNKPMSINPADTDVKSGMEPVRKYVPPKAINVGVPTTNGMSNANRPGTAMSKISQKFLVYAVQVCSKSEG